MIKLNSNTAARFLKSCLIFILPAVIFCGCEPKNVQTEYTTTNVVERNIKIYIIDSCEYIGDIYGGYGDVITHKGNCKFCAERSKK